MTIRRREFRNVLAKHIPDLQRAGWDVAAVLHASEGRHAVAVVERDPDADPLHAELAEAVERRSR